MNRLQTALALVSLLASVGCNDGVKSNGAAGEIVVHVEATPEIGAGPLEVEMTAIVIDYAGDKDSLVYTWSFGDGSPAETGASVSHVFEDDGSYTATVTVTDGDIEGSAVKVIDVGPIGPGVDLTVSSIEATPSSVNPGSPLSVKLTFENQGSSALGGETVIRLFVLPVEELPTEPGTPTGFVSVQGLQGGEVVEALAPAIVPALFSEGDYWVFAQIDGDGDIEEFDETNNVARTALPISVTNDSLPVDLVVDSLTTDLAGPATAGGTFGVTAVVRNAGSQGVAASKLSLRFSVDPTVALATTDPALALVNVPSIAAGQTFTVQTTVTVPMTLDNRPWYFGAIADAALTIAETNESNNGRVAAAPIAVSGGSGCTEDPSEPNETDATAIALVEGDYSSLAVCPGSVDWYRVSLASGDALTATASFNVGDGNLDLQLYREGEASAFAISNGTTGVESVQSGVTTEAGNYLLRASVSASAMGVPYSLSLAIASSGGNGKDLVPVGYTVAPTNVLPGGQVNISFEVRNFGNEDVTGNTTANIRLSTDATYAALDDALLKSVTVAPLAAGASATYTTTATIPAGTAMGSYFVVMRVDALTAVAETYEDNNYAAKPLGVGTGCGEDVWEENDTLATAKPIASGQIDGLRSCSSDDDYFAVQVAAGGTLEVDVLFPDAEGNISAYILGPTGSTLKSGTSSDDDENLVYTATNAGTYYVRVRLSADDGTIAGNSYTLVVDGATSTTVDLSPINVTFNPPTAQAGDEVQVLFDMRNLSTVDAPTTFLSIRLSVDATIDGADAQAGPTLSVPALAAGSTTSLTKKFIVPTSAAGQSWYVGVYADSTNLLTEASEVNNGASSATQLTVPVPCTDDAREENDNDEQPSTISLGTTYTLQSCANDPDWFKVTATSTADLTTRIEFTNADGDLDLHVYDSTGTTLLGYSSSVTLDFEQVTIGATDNVSYLIQVKGFNGAANDYTLRVTQ